MLTNHLLSSLNEIRQCAPYELRREILSRLTRTLRAAVRALAQAHTALVLAASPAAENVAGLCALFSEDLLPHMAAAVDMLVPCAGSVDQEGARREGRGGDGGGERMVAAVRAELH